MAAHLSVAFCRVVPRVIEPLLQVGIARHDTERVVDLVEAAHVHVGDGEARALHQHHEVARALLPL